MSKYKISVVFSADKVLNIEADSLKDAMWKGYIMNLNDYNNYKSSINPTEDTQLVVWEADDSNINLKMSLYELQNRV